MAVNEWFKDFCSGELWDSERTWNTTNPDLTPCFRQTILIWIPAAFLWLFSTLEGAFIARSKGRLIPWNAYNISRLIIVGICIALTLADVMFCLYRYLSNNEHHHHPTSAEFSAPLINFATLLLLEVILVFHRCRGIITSGVVWIYAFLALVCGEPTFYSYCFIERPEYTFNFVTYLIYYASIIILFLLCCFADSPPKYKLPPETEHYESVSELANLNQNCPESEASFLSKLLYWWFNGLAITGNKKSLETSDLWLLQDDDKTNCIAPQFDKSWLSQIPQSERDRTNQQKFVSYNNDEAKIETVIVQKGSHKKPGVVTTLSKTYGLYFFSGAIFKLGNDILQFTSPLLLKALIGFVSKPKDESPAWHGYFIAAILFFVAILQTLMLNFYFQRMFIIGMRVRSALISAIYRKSLNLSNAARKGTTVGEIVNLMSVDAQRFTDLLPFINLVWSAPFQILLAMTLLYFELGPSVFAGLAVMVLMLPLNAFLAGFQRKFQVKQMKHKDERVKFMNEILNGIKVIKLYAWEYSFMNQVFGVRNKELAKLQNMAYLGCATAFLWTCAPFVVALVTFAIYVLSDPSHVLDAQKAFTSMALFNLLRFPMTMLPQMITFIVMTSVSVKRLNKFLNSSELDKYVTKNEEIDAITIESGTFTWDSVVDDGKEKDQSNHVPPSNTLIDINLHIKKGQLIAIVGHVGSGKSSLLSAILGEMDRVSGRVNVNGSLSLAYAAQQAWIQNASLKNNILWGKKYDKQTYESVINACALKPDLEILPGGDDTEIGEKGINLSGGQKHRVSLARACYSDADIYFLDDPLAAVDSHVAKHIFDKVISNRKGILKDKTRVLVTNNISILPYVDGIVVLKDGRISETGTYNELMTNKGDFSEFVTEFSATTTQTDSNGPLMRQSSVISDKFVRSLSVEKSNDTDKKESKLIETEKAETGKVKFKIYMRYFKSITFLWILIILIGMVGMQLASVGSNVWLAIWSNDPVVNGTQNAEVRNQRLGVYAGLGIAQALLVLFGSFGLAKGVVIASNSLHRSLLERILRSPMSFFDTTPMGRIVNRFSKDIDTVDATIPHTMRGWLLCFLQVVSSFVIIAVQTPIFLVVILPIGLLYYFIQRFYVATSRQLKRLESVTRSPIYSHFSETLSGVSTIRAYDSTSRFIGESNYRVDYNQVCYFPSVCANRWLAVRLEFCGNLIILFAAIFAVLERGHLSPGFVGLSITYAMSVTQTLNWLVRMTSELETNIVSVERIVEYCDNSTEAEWFSVNSPPSEWPQNGAITFDHYATRYRTGLELVLRGIQAKVEPGEKIGIVGRTGAGKSSLTLCLFRLIEADSGKIIIDGYDIGKIGLHELRSKLTIIPQDPVLFSGTIRSNLDPFNAYSDTQLWTALEHSHLKHFVKGLESELEYKVSEGGENLSVGQRQLICLGRALLRKTKILILDEATAAVDLETDSLIQNTIRKEFQECTILTIAHRLNTIMDSNRVLVLDKGKIAEFDSPANLLSDTNSIFYSLAKDAKII